jgi:hypothetical protein
MSKRPGPQNRSGSPQGVRGGSQRLLLAVSERRRHFSCVSSRLAVALVVVILRNRPSGFWYAGQTSWVNDRERALDLGTVEDAVETGRQVGFGAMEVVVTFDDPLCELVYPLSLDGGMAHRSRMRPPAPGRLKACASNFSPETAWRAR